MQNCADCAIDLGLREGEGQSLFAIPVMGIESLSPQSARQFFAAMASSILRCVEWKWDRGKNSLHRLGNVKGVA